MAVSQGFKILFIMFSADRQLGKFKSFLPEVWEKQNKATIMVTDGLLQTTGHC